MILAFVLIIVANLMGEQLINIVLKNYEKKIEYHCKIFSQTLSMSIVPLYFPPKVECIYIVCMLGDTGFFRLQGIKLL